MPRILLIEDEAGLAEALEYQLERNGYSVDRAGDGSTGLDRFRTTGPDLVLLDLMLPALSGEDVCRAIRAESDVPIVMLTAKGDEIDRVLGLELGADDYVTKPFSTRELLARIKAILRRTERRTEDGGAVLEAGDIRLDRDRFEVSVEGRQVRLTPKEFELLEYLMENQGRALTRDSLIERVWGEDYFGDTRTLDVHIKRVRAKTERDPSAPRHLLTVRGIGYKFVP